MNYQYGFPLFDAKESTVKAFNYIYNSNESGKLSIKDIDIYARMISEELNGERKYSENRSNYVIITANMKKVQDIACNTLFPYLSAYLQSIGQNHGFIIFNPTNIINSYNPLVKGMIDKVIPYIINEMNSMPNLWIYFDGFVSKDLEQIIKLKYSHYMIKDGDRVFAKLCPQDNFGLIYDFVDDVFHFS